MTTTRRLIALVLLLLALAAFAVGDTVHPQEARALDALPGVYGARVAFGRWLSDADMARLRQVPALRSAWIGYDAGGFDWPDDVDGAGAINVQLTPGRYDGMIEWYAAPSAPGTLWVLVYATPGSLEWGGNPPGTHPTAAWVVARAAWMDAVQSE